jgi:hypothetical protein
MFPRQFRQAGVYKWWYTPGSPYAPHKKRGDGWGARKGDPGEYLKEAEQRGEGRKKRSRQTMWISALDGTRLDARYVDDDTEAAYELLTIWHAREGCGCGETCGLSVVTANPGRGRKRTLPPDEQAKREAHDTTLADGRRDSIRGVMPSYRRSAW